MPPETEQERQLKEEQDIMRQVTQKQALKTYKELAKVRGCEAGGPGRAPQWMQRAPLTPLTQVAVAGCAGSCCCC